MNKEILLVIDAVAHEKQVEKEIIIGALETALASATKKKNNKNADICVEINRDTGDYKTFRQWRILDDDVELMQFPDKELLFSRTQEEHPDKQIGDFIREEIESIPFGRIAVQAARQVIVQKVREAEREQVIDKFHNRIGEMLSGSVKRLDRGNIILDVGSNIEALITRDEMLPREQVRMGDRLRGYLKEVRQETRGPLLSLSRVCPELLVELFTVEVPEIGDGLIEIKGAARDPGLRAKIAVQAVDNRIDPVGACVGMRGSRVQVISNELAGERVDIILWDDDPAQFIINAMSPAEVSSIVVDEESHSMDIAVDEDQLSQAIGRGGQNIKLASQLTGWTLNVMTEDEAADKNEEESKKILTKLMEELEVDEDVAFILANEGFTSIEEVAYVPVQDMLDIEEFDEDIVTALRERAQNVLLTRAISSEEQLSDADPDKDLYEVEGMDEQTAHKLASHGIISMEDLAEQAVDELIEIDGITEEQAAKLIMAARKPWFEDLQEDSTEANTEKSVEE